MYSGNILVLHVQGSEQPVDHLLLHCPIASEMWSIMYGIQVHGVSWVMPKSVVDLIAS